MTANPSASRPIAAALACIPQMPIVLICLCSFRFLALKTPLIRPLSFLPLPRFNWAGALGVGPRCAQNLTRLYPPFDQKRDSIDGTAFSQKMCVHSALTAIQQQIADTIPLVLSSLGMIVEITACASVGACFLAQSARSAPTRFPSPLRALRSRCPYLCSRC
ncbi:hypothetical protein B0H14DRAFT_3890218 [Mycena olivaceomarginata]|nr:hypothetical protein B0H14DRAFT_3890218 [Mycena olivaceomarginata]